MQPVTQLQWPHLEALQVEGGLYAIDLAVTKMLVKHHAGVTDNAAAFLSLLVAAARQGHLCLKMQEGKITPSAAEILEDVSLAQRLDHMALLGLKEIPQDLIQSPNEDSLRPLCQMAEHFYLQKNWFFEGRFISHITRLKGYLMTDPLGAISIAPHLNKRQKRAVETALSSSLSIITGGPGTGKTFTAAQIVKALISSSKEPIRKDLRIILAAPTGKAAAHLEKNVRKLLSPEIKLRSGTLHMLLSIRSSEDMMKPAPHLDADLLIIDEASMIDARLFSYFLSSIEKGARVVLMGDKDQLPPVDSGSLFADLVDVALQCDFLPCTELKDSLRSDRKQILDFASAVNARNIARMQEIFSTEDTSLQRKNLFCKGSSLRHSYETLWDFSKGYFSSSLEASSPPEDLLQKFDQFRILSCTRKGPMGVEAINTFFASRYLSQAVLGSFVACPILITKNDYSLDLFNGEVGVLVQKKKKDRGLDAEDVAFFYDKSSSSIRKIPAVMLTSFEYAYCLSVHKSQGSEYENVVILVPEGSEVFGKEVLYTAVTRAKVSVTIDAGDEILKNLVSRSSRKISGLHARLQLTGENLCLDALHSVSL